MKLKSFSKINLSLTVYKKLKKKRLHNIQSYFCQTNLFDEIKVKKINGKKDIIKFNGRFSKYIDKKNNSIINTLTILRNKNIISNYYFVQINKKIPVFSGLAGGTGNAASIIKYFTKNKISKNLLNVLSKKIGSDLKLFFYDQGFLQNIKTVNNFKKKFNLHFLLIYPNIKSSTKHVYSGIKKYTSTPKQKLKKISDKNEFINFIFSQKNDLQKIVEKKHPIIKQLIFETSQNKGCYFSRMTGSGSACYGVFQSKKSAKIALTIIKRKYPKFWLSIAKTI